MSANISSVPGDHIFIGFAFTGLAFVDLMLYLPCLVVLRTDAELKKHSCFQFMFHLGLTDLVNIVGQAVCGIWTVMGTDIPYWLNKVFGACMNGSWFTYITLLHVIGINRFIEICCSPRWKQLFFNNKAVNAWLAFSWLHGVGWFCLMMTPQAGFPYHRSILTWYYDTSTQWSAYILKINWIMDIVMLKASILWYIAIVIGIRCMVSGLGASGSASVREKERRILRQAALIGLYTFVWAQYWNVAGWLFSHGFPYAFALGNFFWITNSAVNPIVYLTMNQQIKKKVKLMLGLKPDNRVSQGQRRTANRTASKARGSART